MFIWGIMCYGDWRRAETQPRESGKGDFNAMSEAEPHSMRPWLSALCKNHQHGIGEEIHAL